MSPDLSALPTMEPSKYNIPVKKAAVPPVNPAVLIERAAKKAASYRQRVAAAAGSMPGAATPVRVQKRVSNRVATDFASAHYICLCYKMRLCEDYKS